MITCVHCRPRAMSKLVSSGPAPKTSRRSAPCWSPMPVVLTSLLLSVANPIHAQGIDVGGKVGLQFAGAKGSDGANTEVAFGGFVTIEAAHRFALQAELLYSPRPGFRSYLTFLVEDPVTGEGLIVEQRREWAPTYLELPILAKLLLPLSETNRVRFQATVGVSVAFLLGCPGNTVHESVYSLLTGARVDESTFEVDFPACNEGWNSTDVALQFGNGIDFAIGQLGRLIVEARYLLGLSTYSAEETFDIKNRTFAVMVGFAYRIKR